MCFGFVMVNDYGQPLISRPELFNLYGISLLLVLRFCRMGRFVCVYGFRIVACLFVLSVCSVFCFVLLWVGFFLFYLAFLCFFSSSFFFFYFRGRVVCMGDLYIKAFFLFVSCNSGWPVGSVEERSRHRVFRYLRQGYHDKNPV